ncbi:hypothetical protein CI109_101756 [Kwoniella shandongensis]|uniref:Uncharacterized protein n=1 Tax=Kwoniella shandongensis TaxID=1734106 RepID=A0A5M6C689_9TREE|nr:uncharacterized protein CI109_001122 [Kwoniella shandongensis]KAA5530321.1 hypothetical protein CI109_001122 [Kwoniella shandongensis]
MLSRLQIILLLLTLLSVVSAFNPITAPRSNGERLRSSVDRRAMMSNSERLRKGLPLKPPTRALDGSVLFKNNTFSPPSTSTSSSTLQGISDHGNPLLDTVMMTESDSPPSFDAIFSSQQPPPRRSSSNSSSFASYTYQHPYPTDNNTAMVDEPQSLQRQSSFTSGSGGRDHSSSSSTGTMKAGAPARGFNWNRRQDSLRKESLPFNPESDSTLIATAPRGGNNNGYSSPPIGEIMFGQQQSQSFPRQQQQQQPAQHQHQQSNQPIQPQWGTDDGMVSQQQAQYVSLPNPQQQSHSPYSPFHSPQPTPSPSRLDYIPPGSASSVNESIMYDQLSPYGNPALTPSHQSPGTWGQDFLGQGESSQAYAGGNDSRSGMDDMMGMNEPDALNNELQRIISNTSQNSQHHSGEHTPFQPISQHRHSQSSLSGHSRQDSFPTSRSPSPFASQSDMNGLNSQPGGSGFQRGASSPSVNSPFFNKPQSPPALIIPNQHSPSPSLPPIVTINTGASSNGQGGIHAPRQGDLGGSVSGGLLPPANPALEHLTGMAGISPIAPSADGPMIYIQPSTPISGMKDGRGLFDAALRRAGAMAQQNQNGQQIQGEQGQQQQGFNVPPLQTRPLSKPTSTDPLGQGGAVINSGNDQSTMDFAAAMAAYNQQGWDPVATAGAHGLRVAGPSRPRAKSDSILPSPTGDFAERQALFALMASSNADHGSQPILDDDAVSEQWRSTVNAWKAGLMGNDGDQQPNPTLDPRMLEMEGLQQFMLQQQQHAFNNSQQQQLNQQRLPPLNTEQAPGGVLKYAPGEFSPTSMAFYQSIGLYPHSANELPGTSSAPWSTTTFGQLNLGAYPATAGPGQSTFLMPQGQGAQNVRRRSFGGGEAAHPAAGAGTPGYGVEFTTTPFGQLRGGQLRGVGHRRAAKSEDFGRVGTGWGVGAGGSTAEFLQSITGDDGSLLPPTNRGRSHSRNSSASSARSASPALSISSQGSSFSHHSPRMDMPEGAQIPAPAPVASGSGGKKKVAKMKVTSVATEVASTSRRTNSGVFQCPVPGCGSTFTRHFNLKGHLRSHNDERPYKCLYDGCPKAIVGFARQHDCKRHMLLHEGLRPFECEGCGKKFARLDALTRHHKSEQGQECAITHPLPVNPDGSPMSESQYKAYKGITPASGGGGGGRRRSSGVKKEYLSGDDRSGEGEDDLGGGMSGMEEYDRF